MKSTSACCSAPARKIGLKWVCTACKKVLMTDDKPAATSSDELTGDDLVKRVIERVPTWCFSEDPKERERAAYLASVGISNLVKHILHPPPIVEDHEMPEVAPIRKRVRPGT